MRLQVIETFMKWKIQKGSVGGEWLLYLVPFYFEVFNLTVCSFTWVCYFFSWFLKFSNVCKFGVSVNQGTKDFLEDGVNLAPTHPPFVKDKSLE